MTSLVAILFVASSIALAVYSINVQKAEDKAAAQQAEQQGEQVQAGLDENGNLVDAEGNILMTAEDLAASQAQTAEAETDAETAAE